MEGLINDNMQCMTASKAVSITEMKRRKKHHLLRNNLSLGFHCTKGAKSQKKLDYMQQRDCELKKKNQLAGFEKMAR